MHSRIYFSVFLSIFVMCSSVTSFGTPLPGDFTEYTNQHKKPSGFLKEHYTEAQVGFNLAYVIEIGLWRKKEDAIEEFQTLQANHPILKKYSPVIELMDYTMWNNGFAYRLRIGHMRSKKDAEKVCNTMRQDGYQKKCQVEFMPK